MNLGETTNLFGCDITVVGEQAMRALVERAGGNPDEWETSIVFLGSVDGPAPTSARCSSAALEKIKAAAESA